MKPHLEDRNRTIKRRYWELRAQKLSMELAIETIQKEFAVWHLSFDTIKAIIWQPTYPNHGREAVG